MPKTVKVKAEYKPRVSDEIMERFINELSVNEILWNRRHKDYTTVSLRRKVIRKIAKNLNLTAEKIMQLVEYVKKSFHKNERNRHRENHPQWKWFDECIFLREERCQNTNSMELQFSDGQADAKAEASASLQPTTIATTSTKNSTPHEPQKAKTASVLEESLPIRSCEAPKPQDITLPTIDNGCRTLTKKVLPENSNSRDLYPAPDAPKKVRGEYQARLTDEVMRKFLKELSVNEIVWNKRHKYYRTVNRRRNTIREMAKNLNLTEERIMQLVEYVKKSFYKNERKRHRENHPQWKWFDECIFLRKERCQNTNSMELQFSDGQADTRASPVLQPTTTIATTSTETSTFQQNSRKEVVQGVQVYQTPDSELVEEKILCRFCLQAKSTDLHPFLDMAYNSIPFCNIYFQIVGITFKNYPGMPSKICIGCVKQLTQAYDFREKCMKSENKLRVMFDECSEDSNIEFITPPSLDESEEIKSEASDQLQKYDEPEDIRSEESDQLQEHDELEEQAENPGEPEEQAVEPNEQEGSEDFEWPEEDFDESSDEDRPITSKRPLSRECPKCGRIFRSETSFNQHMDQHNNFLRHKCQYCDERFPYWLARRNHVYKVHLKKSFVECDICKRGFTTKTCLALHKESFHQEESPYQCHLCGKTFKNSFNMSLHVKMHNVKEGAVKCDICGKMMAYGYLTEHVTRHMKKNNTLEKLEKVKCPVCFVKLSCFIVLKAHVQIFHPNKVHLVDLIRPKASKEEAKENPSDEN